jgi:copper chaperone CopZ
MEPVASGNGEIQKRTATVVSHTPGRIRLRLHPQHRDPHVMERIRAQLKEHAAIQEVETNPTTGSVLVKYDRHKVSRDDFWDILDDVGVVAAAVSGESGDISASGHSSTAGALLAAVDDVDRRLSQATGRRIDLRLLVPVGLGALGIRLAMLQGGLGFTSVPPFIILWFAFDSFLQLHTRRRNPDAGQVQDTAT